jgi:hypothetical protein
MQRVECRKRHLQYTSTRSAAMTLRLDSLSFSLSIYINLSPHGSLCLFVSVSPPFSTPLRLISIHSYSTLTLSCQKLSPSLYLRPISPSLNLTLTLLYLFLSLSYLLLQVKVYKETICQISPHSGRSPDNISPAPHTPYRDNSFA